MVLGGQMQVLTQPMEDGEAAAGGGGVGLQPGDSHGNFGELGRGLRAMAETVHTPVELHLFSDMQQTEMPGNFADMVLPGNVTLVLHPVGGEGCGAELDGGERAGSGAVGGPEGEESRVQAVIAGYGTPAASEDSVADGGWKLVAPKKVDVPANGRATVEFEPLDVPYGESRCEVRVDGGGWVSGG